MENLLEFILINIELFMLLLIRITGIFVASPIFGRNNIPMMLRIGLSVFMTIILLPLIPNSFAGEVGNLVTLSYYVIQEFLLGILIGFVASIYFSAIYLAGTIIDTQMGFGIVNVFDPQTNTQVPVMGNFYNIILTLIFLAMDGHHMIIRSLVYCYQVMPIGFPFRMSNDLLIKAIVIFGEIFIIAFKFSAPVIATIFLANVLLGILARTMPQMNVFIIGLPLKIFIGILTVMISLQFMIPFSERLFDKIFNAIYEIINILSKG